jgi:hypothetical protein
MKIGRPGEYYGEDYLASIYDSIRHIGGERRRRDYECWKDGKVYYAEIKTDTAIAKTKKLPWEIFRLEDLGEKAYISWGWKTKVYHVVFFSPQLLKLYDLDTKDAHKTIWESWMHKDRKRIFPVGTVTDSDRLTFLYPIPISVLQRYGRCKVIDIGEEDPDRVDVMNFL